jgi:hypothetical protein
MMVAVEHYVLACCTTLTLLLIVAGLNRIEDRFNERDGDS